jgi:hypothetical protein
MEEYPKGGKEDKIIIPSSLDVTFLLTPELEIDFQG